MVVDENDAALHDALLAMCSSTSVPSPGLDTIVARPPARSSLPSIDSTRPRRSAGTAARSNPAPRSRTKTETSSSRDLGVDVDLLDACELGRVRHRLAGCEDDGAERPVDGTVARARDLDANAVKLLDVAGGRRERRHERGVRVADRLVAVEPAAELALLPARQRGDAARLVRVALDQRQRLQHRVVHARGDVGALVAADPGGALGVAVDREPPDPRPGDQQQRARDRARARAASRWRRRSRGARRRRPPPARCRRRRAARRGGSCRPAATPERARPRSGRCRPPTGRRGRGR